jgi:hypothetical protein
LKKAESLFTETGGFIVQVPKTHQTEFETILKTNQAEIYMLGEVTLTDQSFEIDGISLNLPELKDLHENGLRQKLK